MTSQEYIFQDRVVAFVDVLGFREKLQEFEADLQVRRNEEVEYTVSDKVNEFINTLKEVTSRLDQDNLRYYLFSDNICITIDYVDNPDLLIAVLISINELFYSFAQKGYFLRGGIAIGKFVDEKEIALGVPLARAYLMESKNAVYPRILIEEEYTRIVKAYQAENRFEKYSTLETDTLIMESCEYHYLNIFYNVFFKEDKVKFFNDYKIKIEENLKLNAKKENLQVKYKWLATEYNNFLELYTSKLIFAEGEQEPTQQIIDELNALKI